MAIIAMDGFEHYGLGSTGRDRMLDNVYAEVSLGSGPTTSQARTGESCLDVTFNSAFTVRRVFPAAVGEVFVGFAFFGAGLPNESDRAGICQLRSSGNGVLLTIALLPDGSLALRKGDLLAPNAAVTNGPVIGSNGWNHIEVRAVASTGVAEIRVNGVEVLSETGDAFASDFAQWAMDGRGGGGYDAFIDDLVINDASGDYNTTWKGDLRVATLFPDADGTPSGWAREGRDKFGAGVFYTGEGCLYVADQAGFDIGSGDFTFEGWFRFYATPSSGEQTLAGQYDIANNQRSWRLWRDFDEGGALKFSISTDGTFGTVSDIINWSGAEFRLNRWHFVSISRVSGTTYLHIDGRLQGAGASDSNTYHNSTSPLWVGTQLSGTGPSALTSVEADFYADEVRFTVGTGRYDEANYTAPSAAFPRSAPGDPDFGDVELLFGFNESPTVDESDNAYAVSMSSTGSPSSLNVSADAAGKYAVVDERDPFDQTFIAADFLFATGELTLTANAADTETVTLGSTTYTFVDALTGADDVLIGADADESLDNLAAAINGGSGEGVVYGTGTAANTAASAESLGSSQLRATAAAQGTAGNSVTSTETLANGSWTGSTLSGGADIPAAQEFTFTPLPLDTTQVKAIQLYHRSAKSDSGPCNLQASFHVGASSEDGADRPITTAFSYYADVFEEDPDTTAGLTPNSIVAGAFQIDRTT